MSNPQPPFSWRQAASPFHILTVIILFIADQASKYAVVSSISLGARLPVLSFIELTHTKNRGAAFGMFHHSDALFRFLLFGAVTVICLYMLIYWLGTTPMAEKLQRFCFSLILGGAFGNLYDRVVHGEVTDFIDFTYRGYHWYTFNIADSGITVGVTLLIAAMIPWTKIKDKLSIGKKSQL